MQLSNWSYSRYSTWKKCPAIIRFQSEAKEEAPTHPAAKRGQDLHTIIERYLLEEIKELVDEISYYRDFFDALIENEAVPEFRIAVSSAWELLEWDDERRWWRGILDCVLDQGKTALIYDWKTGNEYADHRDQREIYAVAYSIVNPEIETFKVLHVYLDKKLNTVSRFTKEDVEKFKIEWTRKVEPMLADTVFTPNPGFHCRSCHFRRDNGGPCRF